MNLPSIMLMCVHKTCCFGLDMKMVMRAEDIIPIIVCPKATLLHRTYVVIAEWRASVTKRG